MCFSAFSQTHKIPKTSNNTWTICSGILYDHAGTGDYGNNANGYTVIYPSTSGNSVQLTGTYNTEINWDYVYIYNGIGTSGTLLGQYSGVGTIPTFTSTDLSGAITVRFTSDGTISSSGFILNINCIPPCTGTPNAGNSIISDSIGCANSSFDMSVINYTGGHGISYQWESSLNGTYWSYMIGDTNINLTTSTDVLKYFRLKTTCNNSGLSSYSNVVSFTPELCVSTTDTAICVGTIYDSGGSNSGYQDYEDYTTVIYPNTSTGKVRLTGTCNIEDTYDFIYIYNGIGTSTLLKTYTGNKTIDPITSTDISGALTVKFISDYIISGLDGYTGFAFKIECIEPVNLPVELLSFDVSCEHQDALLKWSTATEVNNSHFLLQRSNDAVNFETFATVKGSGNSNQVLNYSYIDDNTHAYYRLVQVDYDNTETIFDIVAANCDNIMISIQPNPFSDKTTLSVSSDLIGTDLYIYEVTGILIEKKTIKENKTIIEIEIPGVYIISFKVGDKILTKKIVKI